MLDSEHCQVWNWSLKAGPIGLRKRAQPSCKTLQPTALWSLQEAPGPVPWCKCDPCGHLYHKIQPHCKLFSIRLVYPILIVRCIFFNAISLKQESHVLMELGLAGFEHPLMACCGYGGPPLNYDSRVPCGKTKEVNGTEITAKGCSDSTEYVNWDGIHYSEAANQYVSSQILTGKYSDPPFSDKMPFLLPLKF